MNMICYNDYEQRAHINEHIERCAYVLHIDDDSECMIALDADTFKFVVVDCEHDIQCRYSFAKFHDSYASAMHLLTFIRDDINAMLDARLNEKIDAKLAQHESK